MNWTGVFFVLLMLFSRSLAAACVPTSVAGVPSPLIAGTGGLVIGGGTVNGTPIVNGGGSSLPVTGTTSNNNVGPLPALSPATFPAVGTATVNSAGPITAGSYGTVNATGNPTRFSGGNYFINTLNSGNIELAAGNYFIDTFNLNGNLTVTGAVMIYIGNKISLGGNGISLNRGGNPANLQVNLYDGVVFDADRNNVSFTGLIYSPSATSSVLFKNRATITGAIVTAGQVQTGTQTTINFNATVQTQINSTACPPVASGPDHYELYLSSNSLSCMPTTATIYACADNSSPCTSLYTGAGGQTVTLTTTGGTLAATIPVLNTSGVATTTLSYPAALNGTSVTVTLSGETIPAANASQCCADGVSCTVASSCATTFNTAGFIVSNAAGGLPVVMPNQVAGVSSGTHFVRAVKSNTSTKACEAALTGASTVDFAYECSDPSTCSSADLMTVNGAAVARNNSGSVGTYTPVAMTFDANGNAPFSFVFNDVGLVKLWLNKTVNSATLSGSTNAFVVKPFGFVLSGIKQTAAPQLANPAATDAAGPKFIKAGTSFSVTVTAVTASNTPAPNFGKESVPEGVKLTHSLVMPVGGAAGTLSNPTVAGGSFIGGVAAVSNLAWDEVGIIKLSPSIDDASYLGAGDVLGAASGNVGRFIPDHFSVSGTMVNRKDLSCPSSDFNYMGEPFEVSMTLTAQSSGNTTTQNYASANGFAKLDPATAAWMSLGSNNSMGVGVINEPTTPLTPRLSVDTSVASPSGSWVSGVGNLKADFNLARPSSSSPDNTWGSYEVMNLGAVPKDSDGVSVPSYSMDADADGVFERVYVTTNKQRLGRIQMQNAYGSELLDLPMPMTAQHWNGNFWVNSSEDLCSTGSIHLSLSDPVLTDGLAVGDLCVYDTGLGGKSTLGCATVDAAKQYRDPPLAGGDYNLNFKAPGLGHTGVMDVTAQVPDYLKFNWKGTGNINPSARASFGIYKGSSHQIYFREVY